MKKLISILLLTTLALSLFVGCKKETTPLITIEDENVTIEEVKFYLDSMQQQYEAQFGEDILFTEFEGKTIGETLKDEALEAAVAVNLCAYIAKERGITLDDETIEQIKENSKNYFESLDEESIKTNNFSLELIENIITDNFLREKLVEEVGEEATIDEAQLNEDLELLAAQDPFYEAIKEYGYDATNVRAKHVLIKTIDESGLPLSEEDKTKSYEKAQEVLERANNGEDFATLVKEYSEDPGSLATDGEYTFGRGEMVAEFEEAAYSLEPGEISDIVETSYGYHIIKLEEKDVEPTEEQIQERKDYEAQVISYVEDMQKNAAFETEYEKWREEYNITIDEETWESVIVKGQTGENQLTENELTEELDSTTEEDTQE